MIKDVFKDLALDVFWSAVYFPLWWYGRGLRKAAVYVWNKIKAGWRRLALIFLLVNFFKPMYGQRGWSAYLLSIASHFFQLLFRLILMLLWSVFWLLIIILWLILPIFAFWQTILLIL